MPLLFAWLLQKTGPKSALTQQEILKTLYYEKKSNLTVVCQLSWNMIPRAEHVLDWLGSLCLDKKPVADKLN